MKILSAKRKILSKREKVFLGCALTAVIGLALQQIVALPLMDVAAAIDRKVLEAEKALAATSALAAETRALKNEHEQFAEGRLQDSSDGHVMSGMLAELENIAGSSGIKITDMKPDRVKNAEFYNRFSVNMVLYGSFHHIVEFVHTAQIAPHQFLVKDLTVSRRSSTESELKCTLELSRILFLPEEGSE